ncbi:cytochrome P450 [Rhodococcus wratislaviensis]|uniref:Putative cytochrome P450 n=1 Tax=Rhodococcus wratislaviensis NBRC 100605 TaxID=1219028 RepID=X0R665_RHOWR|nr:cytochrome P450 [Rhodococcus wratislaviensis]GAF46440.1 putative cytochrome P450 [Rhodococcus wratislaviensis NBRC 100605]
MSLVGEETGANERGSFADFDHNDSTLSAREFRSRHNEMRETCPVAHSNRHGGFEVITRYDDVREVLSAPRTFSSADGVFIPPTGTPRAAAMEFDDPEHTVWRKIMEPPLTVRAVRAFEPTILEIADFLIDNFASRGSADLVHELAEPLPSMVIGRVVGLDHKESLAARSVAARLYSSIGTPEFSTEMEAFGEFVEAQLESRRRSPLRDFLSDLASGTMEGVPIDSDGVSSLMLAYLLGGHHSTGSGIAALLHDVLTRDELRHTVTSSDDPKAMARAVDESLRLNTPLQYFARTVVEDTSIDGECIRQGSRILLDLAAANRDPRRFDDPEDFDLDRRRNAHVAFGGGSHVCLGQHLARAEIRITVSRVLERLPDLELTGECREKVVAGKLLTTQSLPVVFSEQG